MRKQSFVLAAAVALAAVSAATALDQVQMTTKDKPLVGKILSITSQQVEIEPQASRGASQQIPVNEVKAILFDGEPEAMFQARKHVADGEYAAALEKLDKIEASETGRAEVAAEVEYFKAFCTVELARAGNADLDDAVAKMLAFAKNHETSYHSLQACEMVGNLLVAKGAYAKAEPYYKKLAEAPWPDYKMRAGIGMGRALLAQGKTDEAAKTFDEVVASEASGSLAEAQRMAAKVGKARCQAADNHLDEAIQSLQGIIAKADADNGELLALANNALGTALRKAGKLKEAEWAFLRVDLLYSADPEAHAEALANLEPVFRALYKPDQAKRVRAILNERYKNSHWATGTN